MHEMVSIVMPVRNAMPYLKECLDSILQQSYTTWELLAVNDHSDDESNALLQEYALRDKRIRCFQNNGKGIIDALNSGYSHSQGDFITRMDADDIMPPQKLLLLSDLLEQSGKSHLSTGKVKYISESILGEGFKRYEEWLNQLCDENRHYSEIYKECVIPSPCWMMHKSDFESIGAFDSKSYPEDYDLCFRMYENGIKVVPSKEVLHIWRDHGGRASRNDENYSDNRFLELKVHYFIRNELEAGRELILWGAGRKGKQIAQLLLRNSVEFKWVTNNVNKIGRDIYSVKLFSSDEINDLNGNLSFIIAVANEIEQKEIVNCIDTIDKSARVIKYC